MRFWHIGWADLRRRPWRSTLTTLGVAIAVACMVIMVGLARGAVRAWQVDLQSRGTHLLGIRKGAVDLLSTSLDAAEGPKIQAIPGVQSAAGVTGELLYIDGVTVLAEGWPLDCHLWKDLQFAHGRLPLPSDREVVILGQGLSEAIGKRLGDTLTLGPDSLTVVGIFQTRGVMGNNLCVMPIECNARFGRRADRVTAFHIRVANAQIPGTVDAVRERLQQALPKINFLPAEAAVDNEYFLKLLRTVSWCISTVSWIMALVVMLNTLLMSVLERTREIGILTALGWTRRRIVALIVSEGLMLSATGALLGLVLGVAGLHSITSLPSVHGLFDASADAQNLLEVALATIALGIVGSAYPAWRAVCLDPVQALSHE